MTQPRDSQEWRDAVSQKQFLEVISRDEATQRFRQHLDTTPKIRESVSLAESLGRVLAVDVVSEIDVPAFDRSNVDGFAVQAADTAGAMEETPAELLLNSEVLSPGAAPTLEVQSGTATPIATGGMLPRGADAVVMIEHTEFGSLNAGPGGEEGDGDARLRVFHSAASGQAVTFAGTDIARGETVLRFGQVITSREIGVLAAVGLTSVEVWKKPRVAIVSTGNEIVPPGEPLPTGSVYDSNAAILSAAVTELGCEPVALGTVRDDVDRLREIIRSAADCDAIVLSGGTSKGAGDLSYKVVSEFTDPGIVAHGVALKPGKPICLAVNAGRPVVVLPGFPTSAVFTFHEFVAPVLREMAGLAPENRQTVQATLPIRMNSERGRTEYSLVSLVRSETGLSAWPMGKGSGSVTTFSLADGFITIDQNTEILDEGSTVPVTLLGRELAPADLVVIGSHCVGLDFLLGEMRRRGFTSRVLHVGSMGGVSAAKRGECDIAGVHLMNPATDEYNRHLLTETLDLITGVSASSGSRVSPRRRPVRRSLGQRRRVGSNRRNWLHDDQSKPRQRDSSTDRSSARQCPPGRLQRADEISQCSGDSGRAGASGLGRCHRHGRLVVRAGISSDPGRALRLHHSEVAAESRAGVGIPEIAWRAGGPGIVGKDGFLNPAGLSELVCHDA